jgi:hypothetical protein
MPTVTVTRARVTAVPNRCPPRLRNISANSSSQEVELQSPPWSVFPTPGNFPPRTRPHEYPDATVVTHTTPLHINLGQNPIQEAPRPPRRLDISKRRFLVVGSPTGLHLSIEPCTTLTNGVRKKHFPQASSLRGLRSHPRFGSAHWDLVTIFSVMLEDEIR